MSHARLEVCVDNAAGLQAAIDGNADRIELCSALALGGLTPSAGLIDLAANCPIPVRAMIRPRAGNFIFSTDEIEQMKVDIDQVRRANLNGVVLGAASNDRTLDCEVLRDLLDHAGGMQATLHRVIDTVLDTDTALETAIELGFDTVLTSGGGKSADRSLPALARMCSAASGRIVVMPGAGIRVGNAQEVLRVTGANWLHASCSSPVDSSEHLQELGFSPAKVLETDTKICQTISTICHRTLLHDL